MILAEVGLFDFVIKNINKNFDSALSQILSASDTALDLCLALAGIGVLVQIGKNFLRGGDWAGYLEWVPLLGFLLGYGQFVSGLYKGSSSIDFDLGINLAEFIREPPKKIDLNPIQMIATDYLEAMKMAIATFLVSVVNILAMVAFIYIKMKVVFKVALLVFIAPINIGLSFIPSLSHLWQGALLKAIEVALYIPGLALIDWIGKTVFLASIKPSIIKSPSDWAESYVNMELGVLFYGMIAVSYFSVPGLIGWVLDSGGGASSGGMRKLGATVGAIARKLAIKV